MALACVAASLQYVNSGWTPLFLTTSPLTIAFWFNTTTGTNSVYYCGSDPVTGGERYIQVLTAGAPAGSKMRLLSTDGAGAPPIPRAREWSTTAHGTISRLCGTCRLTSGTPTLTGRSTSTRPTTAIRATRSTPCSSVAATETVRLRATSAQRSTTSSRGSSRLRRRRYRPLRTRSGGWQLRSSGRVSSAGGRCRA